MHNGRLLLCLGLLSGDLPFDVTDVRGQGTFFPTEEVNADEILRDISGGERSVADCYYSPSWPGSSTNFLILQFLYLSLGGYPFCVIDFSSEHLD